MPHTMPEHAAQITNLLLERRRGRIRIVFGVKQQRMAALHADVLVTAVTVDELFVIVLAEETRQRVTDVRQRAIFRQVIGAATTAPADVGRLLENVIVDVMTPNKTPQLS